MVLQPLLGSAELLSYIRTNETVLSLVSSTCLLRNTDAEDDSAKMAVAAKDDFRRFHCSTEWFKYV